MKAFQNHFSNTFCFKTFAESEALWAETYRKKNPCDLHCILTDLLLAQGLIPSLHSLQRPALDAQWLQLFSGKREHRIVWGMELQSSIDLKKKHIRSPKQPKRLIKQEDTWKKAGVRRTSKKGVGQTCKSDHACLSQVTLFDVRGGISADAEPLLWSEKYAYYFIVLLHAENFLQANIPSFFL